MIFDAPNTPRNRIAAIIAIVAGLGVGFYMSVSDKDDKAESAQASVSTPVSRPSLNLRGLKRGNRAAKPWIMSAFILRPKAAIQLSLPRNPLSNAMTVPCFYSALAACPTTLSKPKKSISF